LTGQTDRVTAGSGDREEERTAVGSPRLGKSLKEENCNLERANRKGVERRESGRRNSVG